MTEYKKKLVLIPSAYNSKVMGDIENFIKYYKDDFDVYVIYDSEEKEVDNVKYLNKKNPYTLYLKLVADYIIDAGSINFKTRVCDTQKRVSVWHGIPYKKMFIDLDKKTILDTLEYAEGIDLMVSPCKFYTEEFLRKSMLYRGEILETAVSRTDSIFKSEKEKDEIKERLGLPKDKKILLFAPTYRVKGSYKLPFDSSKLLNKLNKDKDEWIIVTKLHYLNTLVSDGNVIDLTSYPCVNDLLCICDLLISDYSSLFFDYSILDKPMIFYQYDKEEYEKDRGFMFKLEDYVDNKYIVTNEKDLLSIIDKSIDTKNLSRIKKTFYPHQKKDSTKELVSKLNFDKSTRKTKDIIFLINELNEIGGINTFVMNLSREFKSKYNSRIFVIANRRYSTSNKDFYEFDKEGLIDVKLSFDKDSENIIPILENTDGYVISCQFGAHKRFERYLNNKNNILMFHGDTKDIISKNIYTWHLKELNNFSLYNYKKLLLLTEGNAKLLGSKVNDEVKEKLGFMENSYTFKNIKNYYKNNNEFAFISRLDLDKNIFDTLEIFKNKNLNKNYKLHVYGDGKLRSEYENKIKELGLEKRVIVHGYCDNKDEMYKDKQGIILTSLTEGFPLTILESANYGVPIYLYNSFTAASEFKDYSCVNLIETSNINEFVKRLNNGEFDKKDFNKIINRFSNDTIVNRWIKLFDEVESLDNIPPKQTKTKLKNFLVKQKRKVIKFGISFVKKHCYQFAKNNKKIVFDGLMYFNCLKYKIKNLFKHKKYPLVSIIVPFYNNIDTVEALLKSIKKSGYKNNEVLLINDGCDQDPRDICKKYKNVKYFKKENEGPGLVRNYGIEKARGKYVFFIDSDDTMCKYALNYLVDYAEKHKLNVVGGRCRKYKYKERKLSFWFKNLYKKSSINTMENRILLLSDTISTCKIYNLEELRKSNIRFEKGMFEDNLFMAQIYKYFDRIGIVNRDVYNWINYGNNSSITTKYTFDQVNERIDKMIKIFNLAMDKYKAYYVTHAINHDMYIFAKFFCYYSDKDKKKIFELYRKYFDERRDYIYFKDVVLAHKRELIRCMLDNDYERFSLIADCISYKTKMEE